MSQAQSKSNTGAEPDGIATGADEESVSVSRDEIFELLSNHRRRYTLHHLQHTDGNVELGELSEQVAAWENDSTVENVSSDERKRVYTSLQQFHLPKLDEQNVVAFDDRSGTVELSEQASDLDVYLEVVEGRDIPWSQYYLALAAVNAAAMAAALINAYPFSLLPPASWGAFAVTTFFISAAVHTYLNRSEMQMGEDGRPPDVGR